MDNKAVKQEYKRLQELLERANISKRQKDTLAPVITNMAWQKVKLDEAMEEMQEESIICEYKNGKTQTGTHENPLFKAYINLWRAYMVGFEKFTSYLPKELKDEAPATVSIIEQVKKMKKAN